MKQLIASSVRKLLPSRATHAIETGYRKTRARAVAARYGNPARALRVIAITGTNGKTTTVHFMNEILKEAGYQTAIFSTATIEIAGDARPNTSHMTVDSVKNMQKFFRESKSAKVDFVIMEFASHAIHQHKLDGVPVEMAIMTNLTQDHLDYHGTMEEYAQVKGRLFSMEPKFTVLNRDDEWFDFFNNYKVSGQKITYGTSIEAEARIDHVKLYRKGTEAHMTIDHQTKLELATALPGEYNVHNMAAAVAGAYLLDIPIDSIIEGVANLDAVPGRYEYVPNDLGFDVVVDYAHTPDGLEKLLQSAKKLTKNRTILVFGACGDRDKEKRPIMGKIAATYADRIILTDEENFTENAQTIRDDIYRGIEAAKAEAKTVEISDRRDAIKKALSIATKGDTILVTALGHQTSRIIDGVSTPWHEPSVIAELITQRHGT